MAISHSTVAVLLVIVFFVGLIQSESLQDSFSNDVQNIIPKNTYLKLFAVNKDSNDQLLEAAKKGNKKFNEVLGADIDKSLQEQLLKEVKRLEDEFKPSLQFSQYAYCLPRTLKDNGLLNSSNVKEMAQKYVEECNKAAKSLKSTNILSTYPSLTGTNARFLKSFGLTSTKNANEFAECLLKFLKKN